ncbi:hypothetical protein Poli38472_008953 [Pythium oligandrum]|uniref:Attractin/MKLN-like beta-propeller domain-containing protein n=1 Tax=Pythium oligandrum TaxID=41045 RepID=A0A8K1C4J4_PYTOL|nr:hypothetical protein Poli38472_008953 [Pythium oligandrum]|eukprot:TMW56305.1 hypothetical protein Poli38472_008953 [Pythium oligandrum]
MSLALSSAAANLRHASASVTSQTKIDDSLFAWLAQLWTRLRDGDYKILGIELLLENLTQCQSSSASESIRVSLNRLVYHAHLAGLEMFDILKLFRNSPRWAQSPLARRLGFSAEEAFEEDDQEELSNWSKLITSGHRPPVRSGHSSLVVGDTMFVFGGYNEGNCHNDIYAFDLIRHHWSHIETSNSISPDGRASHTWCASSDKTKIYLFGGSGPHWGQTNMGKLLQFNIREKSWSIVEAEGTHPPPGYGQSLCAINNKLYLFGGTSGHLYVNDLYVFDEATRTWKKEEMNGRRPSPRYKHQVAVIDNKMYVIGGGLYDPPKGPIDAYYLDVETMTWTELECKGNVPRSRIAHTIVQLTREPHRLIMFGGRDDSGTRRNEMSEFNTLTGEWTIYEDEPGQPDARDFHTAVMHEDQMFIFGGSNGVERNNDVHRYTVVHQPPTLLILAMQAIRMNAGFIPREEIEALPYELQIGVEHINPHVRSPYNTTWFMQLDEQKSAIRAPVM